MKDNNQFDDANDFDDAFMSEQTPDTDLVIPEEIVESRPVKKKKGTGLLRYLAYGVGGVVFLFIALVIWASVSSDSSEPAGQEQVGHESIPAAINDTPPVPTPAAETLNTNVVQEDESDDIELLRSQLKAAQENTAIRDTKYKTLANAYIQLQADYKLLQDSQTQSNSSTGVNKPEYSVLPVLKGVSLVSVYDGYAFVKKGGTVYSIKKGDKVNNADVIEIDPVLRKVITAKGVIE